MAWYHGTYACGCEGRVNVVGPQKDRDWKIEKAFSGLCPECYKKKLEEENAKAAEMAKESGLPELKGSVKQIAWAESLRKKIVDDANQLKEEEARKIVMERISKITDATWYIDNRYTGLLAFVFKK